MTSPRALEFVVFSDDWGGHPSSCQHLFRHIAREHLVLWVNTVGMRAPQLSMRDIKKAATKAARMVRSTLPWARAVEQQHVASTSVRVIAPLMLPLPACAVASRFNRWSATRGIRRAMRELAIENPIAVSTVPNACDAITQIGAGKVVYYCVDDFAQWPGNDAKAVRAMELRLVGAADLVVATSPVLRDRLAEHGVPVRLLAHGVDLDHFGTPARTAHALLANESRPRAVFFGLIDARLDQRLVREVADLAREWTFCFVGPVECDVSEIRRLPNVRFTGSVKYGSLPAIVAGADALILPYEVNSFTATISPLKLSEYLATGLPVIATPLLDVVRREAPVSVASDAAGWVSLLHRALGTDQNAARRSARSLLSADSWEARAAEFLEMCSGDPDLLPARRQFRELRCVT